MHRIGRHLPTIFAFFGLFDHPQIDYSAEMYINLCHDFLTQVVVRRHSPHQGQISGSDVDYLYATTHQFGAQYAFMAELAGKLALDATQQFDTLQQPTLVIWGARALNDTSTRAITSLHNLPTHTELALMPDAGTFVHEEYPALVIANILGWQEHSVGFFT